MEKRKLIRIKGRKEDTSGYYKYSGMGFTFVSKPTNGRVQCASLLICREGVNRIPYLARNKKEEASHNFVTDTPVDFEKLRLLIVETIDENYDDFKTRLFSGKALLNRYEEEAGWSPSKITTVKHSDYKNAWLLTGPKEWMSQPQLLSIATLFIRLMSVHGPLDVDTTFQRAEDSLKTLYNNYIIKKKAYKVNEEKGNKNNILFSYYPDIEIYLKYLDDIKLLITNAKKIFSGIGLDDAWSQSVGSDNFSIYSGILSFFAKKPPTYNDKISAAKNNFMKLKNNGE